MRGAATAHGRYEIGLLISLITFFTLWLITPLEREVGKEDRPEEKQDDSM